MTREELRAASETLRRAAENADGELRERLRNQATQLAELADREPGPDHGRLARHQRVLGELLDQAETDPADGLEEFIEHADEHISAYRETIEGV